jgi:hypothetical protein
MRRMHLRRLCTCLLLTACPPGDADSGSTGTVGSASEGSTTAPTTTPTTSETTMLTVDPSATTGDPPVECIDGGIGPAFSWQTPPETAGLATCIRITDDTLALDCTGAFTGIFTLELTNTGKLGIAVGDELEVDYRRTTDGDPEVGEWLRVRGQNQWYIVAGQGPTLAPPDAPADWFHPNVEVAVADVGCAATACPDAPADSSTPRAISFGQGDSVTVLAPGKDGGVPGEFGGESYHAAVTEAHTGVCGGGPAGAATDLFAFSVVSSGFL